MRWKVQILRNIRFKQVGQWSAAILFGVVCTQSLAAHKPSLQQCYNLVKKENWNKDEVSLWKAVCRSEIYDPNHTDDRVKIGTNVLESILSLQCYRRWITSRGVRIKNVKFISNSDKTDTGKIGSLDLSHLHLLWPLSIDNFEVDSLDMSRAKSEREIILSGKTSRITDLRFAHTYVGRDLQIEVKEIKNADLTNLVVGESLSLRSTRFERLDLRSAIIGARIPENLNFGHIANFQALATGNVLVDHAGYDPSVPNLTRPRKGPGLLMKDTKVTTQLLLQDVAVLGHLHLWQIEHDTNHLDLNVNGLTYSTISLESCKSAGIASNGILDKWRNRCDYVWIAKNKTFSFQPYAQLASVVRSEGDPLRADAILFAGKRQAFIEQRKPRQATNPTQQTSEGTSVVLNLCGPLCRQMFGWFIEEFTGYGVGIHGFIGSVKSILLVVIIGWILTLMCRKISPLMLSIIKLSLSVQDRISGGILKDRIDEVQHLRDLLKERKDADKDFVMADSDSLRLETFQRAWNRHLFQNPIAKKWQETRPLRVTVLHWHLRCGGIGLLTFWLPALMPRRLRGVSFDSLHGRRLKLKILPMAIRWYYSVTWLVSILLVAFAVRSIGQSFLL